MQKCEQKAHGDCFLSNSDYRNNSHAIHLRATFSLPKKTYSYVMGENLFQSVIIHIAFITPLKRFNITRIKMCDLR